MEFFDHQPAQDICQPGTNDLAVLREQVASFASTDPVIRAWARQCAENLAVEDQSFEDMIRLSATVLHLVIEQELEARAAVRRALPAQWRVEL